MRVLVVKPGENANIKASFFEEVTAHAYLSPLCLVIVYPFSEVLGLYFH